MSTKTPGPVSKFLDEEAAKELRKKVLKVKKHEVAASDHPFAERMDKEVYEAELLRLQVQMVRLQQFIQKSGKRLVVLFEGRDAAGKGGCLSRAHEKLNPRHARAVALPAPSDREKGEWYFQRYVRELPTNGEIVFFDRSWYNRAVVERVFGFSSEAERERFFIQVPDFEKMLVQDGIIVVKIWLTVSRAEQLRRFLAREQDPLKQWKLSPVDIASLSKWDEYTDAITDMFQRTHLPMSPWTVIRSDDKRRARLAVMRKILASVQFEGRDNKIIEVDDGGITGDPFTISINR